MRGNDDGLAKDRLRVNDGHGRLSGEPAASCERKVKYAVMRNWPFFMTSLRDNVTIAGTDPFMTPL